MSFRMLAFTLMRKPKLWRMPKGTMPIPRLGLGRFGPDGQRPFHFDR